MVEAVTAGLCGEATELLAEGAAMWRAILDDLAALPGVRVATVAAAAFRQRLTPPAHVATTWLASPAAWPQWWRDSRTVADTVLLIAPETDGLLERLAAEAGAKGFLSDPATIALCADKLRLAEHCGRHRVPHVPTLPEDWSAPPASDEFPCVIKPRDGAGCQKTWRCAAVADWWRAGEALHAEGVAAVRQPWIAGRTLSVAGRFVDGVASPLFPIAEQHITCDERGRLSYRGGRLPAELHPAVAHQIADLVDAAGAALPGLQGYVGFDVLLPRSVIPQPVDPRSQTSDPLFQPSDPRSQPGDPRSQPGDHFSQTVDAAPILCEINPRWTTSYVGYRRLCTSSLMAALLSRGEEVPRLEWRTAVVSFDAEGHVTG